MLSEEQPSGMLVERRRPVICGCRVLSEVVRAQPSCLHSARVPHVQQGRPAPGPLPAGRFSHSQLTPGLVGPRHRDPQLGSCPQGASIPKARLSLSFLRPRPGASPALGWRSLRLPPHLRHPKGEPGPQATRRCGCPITSGKRASYATRVPTLSRRWVTTDNQPRHPLGLPRGPHKTTG